MNFEIGLFTQEKDSPLSNLLAEDLFWHLSKHWAQKRKMIITKMSNPNPGNYGGKETLGMKYLSESFVHIGMVF